MHPVDEHEIHPVEEKLSDDTAQLRADLVRFIDQCAREFNASDKETLLPRNSDPYLFRVKVRPRSISGALQKGIENFCRGYGKTTQLYPGTKERHEFSSKPPWAAQSIRSYWQELAETMREAAATLAAEPANNRGLFDRVQKIGHAPLLASCRRHRWYFDDRSAQSLQHAESEQCQTPSSHRKSLCLHFQKDSQPRPPLTVEMILKALSPILRPSQDDKR